MSRPNISYNLHTLGWRDFQNLSGTVLREILGQTIQQFADTADAGRDGSFYGKWSSRGQESMSGSFVLQCKFTARPNTLLQASDLDDELVKARKLARKGLCQNYLLITNASMRAPVEAMLKTKFEAVRGMQAVTVRAARCASCRASRHRHLSTQASLLDRTTFRR